MQVCFVCAVPYTAWATRVFWRLNSSKSGPWCLFFSELGHFDGVLVHCFSLVIFFQGSIHASSSSSLLLRAAPVFEISVCFLVTGWFFTVRSCLVFFGRHIGVFRQTCFLLLLSKTFFALRVRMESLICLLLLAARRLSHLG